MNQFQEFLKKVREDHNPALKATIESQEAFKHISSIQEGDKATIKDMAELLNLMDEYDQRKSYGGHLEAWFEPGTPYGIDKLPKHAAFFEAGTKYRIRAAISGNRCLAEGTLIATPKGPVPIEDIRVGDFVYDRYGEPTLVTQTHDNGEQEVFEVTSRGKVMLTCTPNHELDCFVRNNRGKSWKEAKVWEERVRADELSDYASVRRVYVKSTLSEKRSFPDRIKLTKTNVSYIAKTYDITVAHPEHFYLLANGISVSNCGKSQMSAYEAACHATGLYPPFWKGKRFNRPVKVWACGISWGQVKEAIQAKIYGIQGNPGTGMIARDLIVKTSAAAGIPGALESMTVRHISGQNSIIAFKTYEQGIRAFQGAEVDFILLDEEPPYEIFDECDVRLMTTGGCMVMTFTPQMGLTPTLVNLYKNADLLVGAEALPEQALLLAHRKQTESEAPKKELKQKTVAIVQISMYDVPWLSEEQIEDRKLKSPSHLVDSRIYGRVTIGEGTIYPISIDKLICDPFKIPKHWKRTYGMDVGWQVTAAEWIAIDPETDIAYVYSEYRGEEKEPLIHAHSIKAPGEWIVGSIDYSANARNQTDGKRLVDIYRNHGLKLMNAEKAVEAGIYAVWERMATGRLKIFKNCRHVLAEIPIYRRDEKGKIIKEHDHALDSLRYAIMGLHYAKAAPISSTSLEAPTFKEYRF